MHGNHIGVALHRKASVLFDNGPAGKTGNITHPRNRSAFKKNITHSAVYDLDCGRDWSYVFVQDAYQWDSGKHNGNTVKNDVKLAAGNLNGSGVNGYDTTGVFNTTLSGAHESYNPAVRIAFLLLA